MPVCNKPGEEERQTDKPHGGEKGGQDGKKRAKREKGKKDTHREREKKEENETGLRGGLTRCTCYSCGVGRTGQTEVHQQREGR